MLTYTMTMSNLGDILITQEQEARTMSLKMWVLLITLSIMSSITERLVSSRKYEILEF